MRNKLHPLTLKTHLFYLLFINNYRIIPLQRKIYNHNSLKIQKQITFVFKHLILTLFLIFVAQFLCGFNSINQPLCQMRKIQKVQTKQIETKYLIFQIIKMENNFQTKQANTKLNNDKKLKTQGHSCCSHQGQLSKSQQNYLIQLIKQRYISPYKIVYMINQQEADLFKLRNQNSGCCSSSSITIPKHQMTKTQLYLSEAINHCLKMQNLNPILEEISDKFENIVKSGQKQNLKVDDNVQKFLVQKVLSEAFNLYIYKIVIEKLKYQNESISNSAMLWATPNTWYARYPDTPLNFLSSETLSPLNSQIKGYGFQKEFLKDYKDNLLKQLKLLEQDGKFEQLLWNKNFQSIRNDKKSMNFPENYAFDGTQQSYRKGQIIYPNLKKSLLTLKSIPFELNQKSNAYCTISENNQICYFKNNLIYSVKSDNKSKYSTFCLIGGKSKCKIISRKNDTILNQKQILEGQLIIIDNNLCDVSLEAQNDYLFLFKSWICTLPKK